MKTERPHVLIENLESDESEQVRDDKSEASVAFFDNSKNVFGVTGKDLLVSMKKMAAGFEHA